MYRRVSQNEPTEPLTPAEVKQMLRIDEDEFDTQLPLLMAAAREVVEQQTGWALVEADYEWTPVGERREPLPLWPASVTSGDADYPILFTTEAAPVPAALKVAIVLLVGEILKNPEAVITDDMIENPAFQRLVFPHRRMDL